MHLFDDQLAIFDAAPAILQIHTAGTDRLYLCAGQLDSRFKAFHYEIIVPRFFVDGNGFRILACHR